MLTLLAKDFKLIFAGNGSLRKKILSYLFGFLVIGGVVAIETVIFASILTKISSTKNAPVAFMTLFLFIISVLMIVMGVINAKKLFFNEKDIEQLTKYPVSNEQIILSKLIFLALLQYVTSFVFTFPIFVSYGVIFQKDIFFYYQAVFYPVLTFVFECGIILLLVYPFKVITDFLKKHLLVQFIVGVVLIAGFSMIYGKVLNLFIQIVASNNLNYILSTEVINSLIKLRDYFIPVNFLTDIFLVGRNTQFLPYLLISIGILSLGLIVSISAFNYFRNMVISDNGKPNKERQIKIVSINKALFKKELILLFKDSNYLLSFTGLLVVQPFLAYLVINSLNTVFTSGKFSYYVSILPNFIPLLDILLIMLFTLIINQGANSYIQMEDKNIRLMKSIPVSPFRQLGIKAIIPFTLSSISLIVSIIVLMISHILTFRTGCFAIILSLIVLFVFDLVSLYEELNIRRNKPRSMIVSTIYSYLLPILYFVVTVVASYFGANIFVVYGLGALVFILLGIPYLINFKSRVKRLFMDLELVN